MKRQPRNATKLFLLMISLLCGLSTSAVWCAPIADTPPATIRAYPNPWRIDRSSSALIRFDGFNGAATIKIYTIAGELVQTLHGNSPVGWDIRNSSGEPVAAGVYIYLATPDGGSTFHGKLIVIK